VIHYINGLQFTSIIILAIKDACKIALSQLEGSLMGQEKKANNKTTDGVEVDSYRNDKVETSAKTKPKSTEETENQVQFFHQKNLQSDKVRYYLKYFSANFP